jgi:hypothetical protein
MTHTANLSNPTAQPFPKFIYPDSEERDRIINFTITGCVQRVVFQAQLSVQIRHVGHWYIGTIERQNDGWIITHIWRTDVALGTVHETPEAAAIACYELYKEQKRSARLAALAL